MHIIFALVAAAALLCLWLTGHWFVRILVWLILTPVILLAFAAALDGKAPNEVVVLLSFVSAAIAWPISGIPLYHRRWQTRQVRRPVIFHAGRGTATGTGGPLQIRDARF